MSSPAGAAISGDGTCSSATLVSVVDPGPPGPTRNLRSTRYVPIGPPITPPETMPTIAAATASVAAPGTPACSNNGANAKPVAGPPVRVTDPASTPINGC